MRKIISILLIALLSCAMFASCNEKAPDIPLSDSAKLLTADLTPIAQTDSQADDIFVNAISDFGVKLYNAVDKDHNTMISPLSVMTALAMTANGAKGETLSQMESALGGIKIDKLNSYLKTYAASLTSGDDFKLSQANSIWVKNHGFNANTEFLQRACDYYNAAIYSAPFDDGTVKDINSWVSNATDGMIKEALDHIDPESVMFLINAVCFDSKWENKYKDTDINKNAVFHAKSGDEACTLMNSEENRYISGNNVKGFVKYYSGKKYAFAAFLPDDGITPDEWLKTQSGSSLLGLIKNASDETVYCSLPKFKSEYSASLVNALKTLGINDAFYGDLADFSEMGSSPLGNIYIGGVQHKTFIDNNEIGTKAAAVTVVDMTAESISIPSHSVILDRPFAYAIIDVTTSIPIFLGTVNSVS